MAIGVCVSGATGWVGRELVQAVADAADLTLVGAVARAAAGKDIGVALGRAPMGVEVAATVAQALARPTDVLVDYSHPSAVKGNVLAALERGVHAVVGTSGLGADDYAELDRAARARGVGVVAAGNFSLTAALMQHFALVAARHVADWEVLDYAKAGKPDQPSGTARELAERLSAVGRPGAALPLDKTVGPREARGADLGGTRVHSIRLPGYVLSCEAVFGMEGERLSIRHDAGSSAGPYVAGTLVAVRRVASLKGLVRGLDTLLFGEGT